MSEELMEEMNRLPLEEKRELRAMLDQSIRNGGMVKSKARCSILLRVMEQIIGHPVTLLDRRPENVWARTMIAYQMLKEGYSTSEVGRQMLKDHSTIVHLKYKMQDALDLPEAYRDILPVWEEFQKRIEQ